MLPAMPLVPPRPENRSLECAAIIEYLYEIAEIEKDAYVNYLNSLEEISKMLYGLIRGLDKKV